MTQRGSSSVWQIGSVLKDTTWQIGGVAAAAFLLLYSRR